MSGGNRDGMQKMEDKRWKLEYKNLKKKMPQDLIQKIEDEGLKIEGKG